jgi:tetratricopeptide (TPR) repeat protein
MRRQHLFLGLSIFIFFLVTSLLISELYQLFRKPQAESAEVIMPEVAAPVLLESGTEPLGQNTPELEFKPEETHETSSDPEGSGGDEKIYEDWIAKGYDLARQEQYTDALHALDKALELKPESITARVLAAKINCFLGKKSFGERNYPRAEELFKEVLHYQPRHLCGLLGLGLCAYKKDVDPDKAKTLLEAYLQDGGKEAIAYEALGEICYHMNDLEKASYYLDLALQSEPANPRARQFLARIKREQKVEKDFGTYDTIHFAVKYEGLENTSVGVMILQALEEARLKVGITLDYYPNIPITAILYTNEQFQDVTHSPAWANAIYDGKIRIPTKGLNEKTETLERLVFHEYTHALIFEYTRGNQVPVWFHEGLAQYSEGLVSSENERVFQAFAKYDPVVSLRRLDGSFLALNQMQASIAYAESLAAIKYIATQYGEYALRAILKELADGKTMGEAIHSVLYASYEEFDNRFLDWLKINYK